MFWYIILTCTCIWGCSILAGWHNKFNHQVRLDQPPTFMLMGELKEEAATVELDLKEISAGFSTMNTTHKYERVNRQCSGSVHGTDLMRMKSISSKF